MTKKNRAFLFYASNLDVLEKFPEEEARRLALIIMEYGFKDESFQCSEDDELILHHIFMGIDAERKRYETGEWLASLIFRVSNLASIKGITEEEQEATLKVLKRFKARAHRQDVEEKDVVPALSPRIQQTLRLESPQFFRTLGLSIEKCNNPSERDTLKREYNHLVMYFYSVGGTRPPEGVLL